MKFHPLTIVILYRQWILQGYFAGSRKKVGRSIVKNKPVTDIYREGNVVYISRLKTKYSPAELLLKYMEAAGIDTCSSLPLFRQLNFYKSTNSCTLRSFSLSYSSFREAFNALKSLGYVDARWFTQPTIRRSFRGCA